MALPDSIPELNRNFHTYGMCHIDMTLFTRPLVFTWEKKKVDWSGILLLKQQLKFIWYTKKKQSVLVIGIPKCFHLFLWNNDTVPFFYKP